jgi:ATP-binding cassette subfamily B multidrug efflux pump
MRASRASMEQAAGTMKQMLEARDPRDLFALGTAAQVARLIGGFVRRHWRSYASSAVMLFGVALCTVLVPRKVGAMIDGLAAHRLGQHDLTLGSCSCSAWAGHLRAARGWRLRLYSAAYRLGVELRTRLYARLSAQGPAFYQRQRTGDLMALATNDIDAIEQAAGEAMLAGFDGTLTLVMVLGVMFLGVDWRLTLIALLPFPLMALAFWRISSHIHTASTDSLKRFSALNDHVQETLSGVRTLRALGLEQRSAQQFGELAAHAADASLTAQKWEAAYEPAVGLTLTAATGLTLGLGGYLVWNNQLTIGALTSFTMYLGQLIWPMFAAGWVLSLIERGRAALARLQPLLDAPLAVDDHGTLDRSRAARWCCATCSFAYGRPGSIPACAEAGVGAPGAGPDPGPGRPHRRRQVDPAARAAAPGRRRSIGQRQLGRPCAGRLHPGHAARRDQLGAAGILPVLGLDRREHRARPPRRQRARRSSTRRTWPPSTTTSCASRRATTPRSAKKASRCRAASASAWRSPARCWPTKPAAAARRRPVGGRHRHRDAHPRTPRRTARRAQPGCRRHRQPPPVGRGQRRPDRRAEATAASSNPAPTRALLEQDGWYASQWRYQQLEASLDAL